MCFGPLARRIGGAERRAGAIRQLGHQVAFGRGVRLPIQACRKDIGIARQYPRLRLRAPEAGMFFAQLRVGGKGIRVNGRRIGIKAEHGQVTFAASMRSIHVSGSRALAQVRRGAMRGIAADRPEIPPPTIITFMDFLAM